MFLSRETMQDLAISNLMLYLLCTGTTKHCLAAQISKGFNIDIQNWPKQVKYPESEIGKIVPIGLVACTLHACHVMAHILYNR